jgi:hypothetical protein
MMNKAIAEIIEYAKAEGLDPAELVRDYLCEKDSRVSLAEARRIVERSS